MLPIDDVLPQILDALHNRGNVVLRAPTGAGKTTHVPPAMWDAGIASSGSILVLQPRRVAARATAARMASERGLQLGREIGFQTRFERKVSRDSRIICITEGILLRRLLDDPFLDGVAAVVFDEFHERNLASDLALGMVRQVQQNVRPELKLVVMSATLDPAPIAAYLGDCPAIESQGRAFRFSRRDRTHPRHRPPAGRGTGRLGRARVAAPHARRPAGIPARRR
jgi:ATP-dependent helicase HrpB